MSHAHGPEGIKRAVRAGVRSIDHGTYLDEEAAAMMVERGTWLVPTLTAGDTTDALANDPKVQPAVRDKLRGLGRPEFDAMRLAAEAGVKVAMGTDCPVAPHGTNLNELRHMAANGFTPEQALHAATLERRRADGAAGRAGHARTRQARGPRGRRRRPARVRRLRSPDRAGLEGRVVRVGAVRLLPDARHRARARRRGLAGEPPTSSVALTTKQLSILTVSAVSQFAGLVFMVVWSSWCWRRVPPTSTSASSGWPRACCGVIGLAALYSGAGDRTDGGGGADHGALRRRVGGRSAWRGATAPSRLQLAGIVLAIVGVVLASRTPEGHGEPVTARAMVLAVDRGGEPRRAGGAAGRRAAASTPRGPRRWCASAR